MDIQIIATQQITNNLDTTREFGCFLLKANSIIRMLHWYTLNYNAHKILGNLYEDLDGLFDKLQEEIIGICRLNNMTFPKINPTTINLDLDNISQFRDENQNTINLYYRVSSEITNTLTCLDFKNFTNQVKSGIDNTVDEIVTRLNKSNYLLSMVKFI
jgi:hypothetical protein